MICPNVAGSQAVLRRPSQGPHPSRVTGCGRAKKIFPKTISIANIQDNVSILAADAAFLAIKILGAPEDAPPCPPRPGRNTGRANGRGEMAIFFDYFTPTTPVPRIPPYAISGGLGALVLGFVRATFLTNCWPAYCWPSYCWAFLLPSSSYW